MSIGCRQCCCYFFIPGVKGEVDHGYHHLFLRLFFPHFLSLCPLSKMLLLSHNVVLHSYPTPSRPLLTQSSSRILSLYRILFLPLSVHLVSLPVFHFPLFPRDRPIQPTPHSFFLKFSFTPTSTLNSSTGSGRYLYTNSHRALIDAWLMRHREVEMMLT